MNSHTFVSVIIPVYNDTDRLLRCLQALEEQTYPQEAYEVIVVDNASETEVEPLLAEFRQVMSVYEAVPGSYAARNRGIALAQGEILAFTDSDCLPAPDWIEKGVKHLIAQPNCGLVGGELVPQFAEQTHPTAVELYEVLMYYPQKRFIEVLQFSVTANLFTYKEIFQQVGLFESRLKSSGDREWGQRVASAGYRLVYAEDVRVVHPVRNALAQIRRKVLRLAGGYEERTLARSQSFPVTLQELVMSLLPPVRSMRRFGKMYHIGRKEKIQVLFIWGMMKGLELGERVRVKLGLTTSKR